MKVRIAEISEVPFEDTDDMCDRATPVSVEEFGEKIRGIQEIVLSQQAVEAIEKMGMTQDEFIAMLLKQAKASQ